MEQEDPIKAFLAKKEDRASKYLKIIEDMMGDYENYHFAEDTLIGIYDYVLANNDITDKQVQAVENIRASIGKRQW